MKDSGEDLESGTKWSSVETTTKTILHTGLASDETPTDLLIDINPNNTQTNQTVRRTSQKTTQNIVLEIPNVEQNRFLWLPLTLLLFSAMFAHMGIKLIPWMLIGEVREVISNFPIPI